MRPAIKLRAGMYGFLALLLTSSAPALHAGSLAPSVAAAFARWADQYAGETNGRVRSAMLAEGVTAARQRPGSSTRFYRLINP